MGQKYAAYDSGNGNLLGFYDSVDSPVPEGKSAIEITDEQWQTCLSSGKMWQVINGELLILGPTREQTVSYLSGSVTVAINQISEEWGYDNIQTAVSYINSSNAQFAAEAQALLSWRDQVWTWAIEEFKNVMAEIPLADFLASMPPAPAKPTV